jgi:hypothetical protein
MDNSPLLDRSINLTVVVERPSTSIKDRMDGGQNPIAPQRASSLSLSRILDIHLLLHFIDIGSAKYLP